MFLSLGSNPDVYSCCWADQPASFTLVSLKFSQLYFSEKWRRDIPKTSQKHFHSFSFNAFCRPAEECWKTASYGDANKCIFSKHILKARLMLNTWWNVSLWNIVKVSHKSNKSKNILICLTNIWLCFHVFQIQLLVSKASTHGLWEFCSGNSCPAIFADLSFKTVAKWQFYWKAKTYLCCESLNPPKIQNAVKWPFLLFVLLQQCVHVVIFRPCSWLFLQDIGIQCFLCFWMNM